MGMFRAALLTVMVAFENPIETRLASLKFSSDGMELKSIPEGKYMGFWFWSEIPYLGITTYSWESMKKLIEDKEVSEEPGQFDYRQLFEDTSVQKFASLSTDFVARTYDAGVNKINDIYINAFIEVLNPEPDFKDTESIRNALFFPRTGVAESVSLEVLWSHAELEKILKIVMYEGFFVDSLGSESATLQLSNLATLLIQEKNLPIKDFVLLESARNG